MNLTRRQSEIVSITSLAGGAASFRIRDGRAMRAIRAVSMKVDNFHYRWTGGVAYCWSGDRCPFVQGAQGGYEHEENVCETADVIFARNHARAMARLERSWK